MAQQPNYKIIAILLGMAMIFLAGYLLLAKMPDNRTTAERVGDAIRELPNGADKATDQLKDRNGIERMGDTINGIGK